MSRNLPSAVLRAQPAAPPRMSIRKPSSDTASRRTVPSYSVAPSCVSRASWRAALNAGRPAKKSSFRSVRGSTMATLCPLRSRSGERSRSASYPGSNAVPASRSQTVPSMLSLIPPRILRDGSRVPYSAASRARGTPTLRPAPPRARTLPPPHATRPATP